MIEPATDPFFADRSLNESIFYSIPPVARNTVNDRMRDILMRPNNDAGRAAVCEFGFGVGG